MNKCPLVTLHANYNAHASQKNHLNDNFSFDYYLFSCAEKLLSNPVEILKSAFIRPEDLHYYEEAGVDNIKLVERIMTTEALGYILYWPAHEPLFIYRINYRISYYTYSYSALL